MNWQRLRFWRRCGRLDALTAIEDAERQHEQARSQTNRVNWTARRALYLAERAGQFVSDTEQSWRLGGQR